MTEWSGRVPDQIMTDFENEVRAGDVAHAQELLHEILADILDTAERDLRWRFQRSPEADQIDEHLNSVRQYITNLYGED